MAHNMVCEGETGRLAALFWVFKLGNQPMIYMLIIFVIVSRPYPGYAAFNVAHTSLRQPKVTNFFKRRMLEINV